MSITDELRERAKMLTHWWYDPVKDEYTYTTYTMPPSIDAIRLDSSIIAIADRIDAEHEKAMSRAGQLLADAEKDRDYNYANWQECKQRVLQGNITFGELNAKIEHLMDELSHCIELPKDADGEYIHIGDKLIDEDDKLQKPAIVKCILYNDEGCVVSDIDPRGCWYDPSLLRHHHAPTVEDVLREFAEKMNENLGMYTGEAIDADEWRSADNKTIAEYAKRLTLAEGEDA